MKKSIILIILVLIFCIPVVNSNVAFESVENSYEKPDGGYIGIPKINLNQIFLNNNNVDKNITVIEPSEYPDVENSLLILAGHSGTGAQAYFNNLYKLGKGEKIYISYNGKKYEYSIIDIYYQEKTGKINIYRYPDTTMLVLVTCTNNNSKMQTVYVAILDN